MMLKYIGLEGIGKAKLKPNLKHRGMEQALTNLKISYGVNN